MPTFGSLFSGVGGMDLGLEWAGWECRWQVEIDDWRRQVLTRHWPEVPKWKDVRDFPNAEGTEPPRPCQGGFDYSEAIEKRQDGSGQLRRRGQYRVDLICAGVPCQDVSVAGRRAGLAGERTGLFFEFARILRELQPRWFLFENVPGLLSSSQGLDFAVILNTLDECGYGVSWRILNSQFFGVPQRRRRVFIVGHLGSPCPPEILFESEGGGGNTPTGGKAGQRLTSVLNSGPPGTRRDDEAGLVAGTLDAAMGHHGYSGLNWQANTNRLITQPLRSNRWGGSDSHGDEGNVVATGTYWDGGQVADTLDCSGASQRMPDKNRFQYVCAPADPDGMRAPTGDAGWLDSCSRCPDGRRYAALGDAVTVPVAEWIGRRILRYAT